MIWGSFELQNASVLPAERTEYIANVLTDINKNFMRFHFENSGTQNFHELAHENSQNPRLAALGLV